MSEHSGQCLCGEVKYSFAPQFQVYCETKQN